MGQLYRMRYIKGRETFCEVLSVSDVYGEYGKLLKGMYEEDGYEMLLKKDQCLMFADINDVLIFEGDIILAELEGKSIRARIVKHRGKFLALDKKKKGVMHRISELNNIRVHTDYAETLVSRR